MLPLKFIEISTSEIPQLLEMMADFYAIDHYPFDRAATGKNLFHFVSENNLGKVWLIKSNEVICGYLILTYGYSFEHNGRDAFIDEFYLMPEFRKMGIGKYTMDFIDEQAIQLGIHVVHLEVEQHNTAGTMLYRDKGYKDNGRILLSKKISIP